MRQGNGSSPSSGGFELEVPTISTVRTIPARTRTFGQMGSSLGGVLLVTFEYTNTSYLQATLPFELLQTPSTFNAPVEGANLRLETGTKYCM